MFDTVITYINTMCRNDVAEVVKTFKNKKLGVSVSIMPAKYRGCFQPNHNRVKVTINDYCVGRTCNGDDFRKNEQKVKQFLRDNDFEFDYMH